MRGPRNAGKHRGDAAPDDGELELVCILACEFEAQQAIHAVALLPGTDLVQDRWLDALARGIEAAAKADSKNILLQYILADRYREIGQVEKSEQMYKALLAAQPPFTFDAHVHVIDRQFYHGGDIGERVADGQFDLPRAKEGGVNAMFFSLFVTEEYYPKRYETKQALRLIDLAHRQIEKNKNAIEIALNGRDLDRIVKSGKIALTKPSCMVNSSCAFISPTDLAAPSLGPGT